jgi:serine O-acetyltransferase
MGATAKRRGFRRLARLTEMWLRLRYGTDLPTGAGLSDNVILMHNALGVVMHQETRFLGQAMVFQHVTFGGADEPDRQPQQAPVIGDRVYIGANALLLGPITIGHDVIIGAGAVVVRDVPPRHRAVGNPVWITPLEDTAMLDRVFGAQAPPP